MAFDGDSIGLVGLIVRSKGLCWEMIGINSGILDGILKQQTEALRCWPLKAVTLPGEE